MKGRSFVKALYAAVIITALLLVGCQTKSNVPIGTYTPVDHGLSSTFDLSKPLVSMSDDELTQAVEHYRRLSLPPNLYYEGSMAALVYQNELLRRQNQRLLNLFNIGVTK